MNSPPQTEASFQTQVMQLAKLSGWRCAHFRPARTVRPDGSVRYRTPVQADGKGFLDLVLVRDCVLWVELKTDAGRLTPEQRAWAEALEAAGQRVCIWRPKDWACVVEVLTERP